MAAKKANIHEYILSLPEKYKTVLSENAGNISVGHLHADEIIYID